jgi:uracil-DNA glycosylase
LAIIKPKVIVCLGKIAFDRILKVFALRGRKFSHGAVYELMTDHWLLASYHPSQQNTLTGKLTIEMFDKIWEKAKSLL